MLPAGVRLIHIRHGETPWNVEGRLQGQRDIPMNDKGRGQAERHGKVLAALLAREELEAAGLQYVSSPLGRSAQTMALVRAALGLKDPAPTDARLMEVDFGDWSGWTYGELRAGGHKGLVRKRKADKWTFRPPGGETYGELAARVGAWLETVTRDTVAVTHGGVLRVLHGHICGTPWHEVPGLPAPQDRFAVFRDGRVDYH